MQPKRREIQCPLHAGTLIDLIIAHLHNVGVIRDTEEVTDVLIGTLQGDCFTLTVSIEPDVQVYYHV